ncbi:GNAT family N-acetyltransferase [Haloferax sp. MBLA0076]|uniref:GNAT family N-acetyltransferase n=1 Tax=Haloferax litoreum TaxID=2666140 RepID=A0A6A8GJ82_9EURY|nr:MULTISPECIES: GNAT family N-acetyltransferase [Haloferax]KAB1194449.1 GNAT family N-acetyltransferase [Haloferax sp. CBA1148]MRX23016.1 GNAT family N-acetyltransferase [Haloferax litoreum]
MQLTEATTDDIDVLIEYWYALASGMEQYSEFNTLSYDSVGDVPEDGFERHFERDDITDYLVEEAGETIGFLTLAEGEHPSREFTRYVRIVNLFVEEGYRNQGYGSAVVSQVKELARANDCDHLKVSCEWHNDGARRFYRETGFEEKQVTFVQQVD